MAYQNPSVQDFKDYWYRAFKFDADPNIGVTDLDITNAFLMTNTMINQALFCTQEAYTLGYLNLAAHNLTMNIRASSQGLNGQYAFIEQSKSVGSVSQSFAIPDRILANPYWAGFMKTNFGAAYLMMILPQLTGQVYVVAGSTRP